MKKVLLLISLILIGTISFSQTYKIKRIYLTGIEGGMKASGEIKITNESILVYYEIQGSELNKEFTSFTKCDEDIYKCNDVGGKSIFIISFNEIIWYISVNGTKTIFRFKVEKNNE